ncbi:4-alpha-N-acetylgalactosaminyltransferase [Neorhodopirellula pilleata]|uniref:4-alpha-N-acetylgalactosaminyltransferase n=2 Tax=Neorhodopirellula pilleata TaxID=2714738 RepID=A0A5C6AXT1_9BACT|nr:4-alpha-N-acetylgalactosaminyltransferase [Neorhodopirellula pilleata]
MAGLVSRLADRGHAVTLISLDDGQSDRHTVSETVARRPLDVMSTVDRWVPTFQRLARLRRAVGSNAFDVVLSFCDATNVLVLLATRGDRSAPPIVVSERSDPAFQSLGRLKEFLRNRLYGRASRVVCLSDEVATTLHHRTGVNPIVIPSAVDPVSESRDLQSRASQHDGERLTIIAAGRLEHEKGFDRLLNALGHLNRTDGIADWHLEILGEGSQRDRLVDLAASQGVADHVTFRGWVRPIQPSLLSSDLFVLPSRYEGFPSAMLEAMACGVAVVAVDAGGGVRAAIEHNDNGWLVENNEAALAAGIAHLVRNPTLRSRLASNASRISDRYSWDTMVDAYEQVLVDAYRKSPTAR